jgi:hypothetical protein
MSFGAVGGLPFASSGSAVEHRHFMIDADVNSFNLATAMGSPTTQMDVTCWVREGVRISTSLFGWARAFTTGSTWHASTNLLLVVMPNSSIIGGWGLGGGQGRHAAIFATTHHGGSGGGGAGSAGLSGTVANTLNQGAASSDDSLFRGKDQTGSSNIRAGYGGRGTPSAWDWGDSNRTANNGSVGRDTLYLQHPLSVINWGTIAGGGGGGGGGGADATTAGAGGAGGELGTAGSAGTGPGAGAGGAPGLLCKLNGNALNWVHQGDTYGAVA